MGVRVVTDSTAELAPSEAEALGVTVVPLYVTFGPQEVYRDGVDLSVDDFFRKLVEAKGPLPTTSQPSPGDFEAAYWRLARDADGICSIHIAGKLSGTCEAARLGATAVAERSPVEVVDSLTTSLGLTFVVRRALQAARGGASLAEVAELARQAARRIHTYAMLDTLEYLRRGGRLDRTKVLLALVSSALNIKPIVKLREGEIVPADRARGRGRALERIVALAASHRRALRVGVAHATDPADAEAVAQRLRWELPAACVEVGRFGPVLGVHTGPGALAIMVLEEDGP